MTQQNIVNSDELEFAIFCIENIADKLGVNAEKVYTALTEKSSILKLYFDNLIDKKEAIKRLYYEKPNMQICFRTEVALKQLHFEGSVEV